MSKRGTTRVADHFRACCTKDYSMVSNKESVLQLKSFIFFSSQVSHQKDRVKRV